MDTAMGGEDRAFPTTCSDLLLNLRSDAERTAALELLCARYWKPVYSFIRGAWRKPNEDSKDLTQAFFVWLIQGDAIESFDASLGGFRPFLKGILRNFVRNHEAAGRALKRGGGVLRVSLATLEGLETALPSREESPEEAFDRAWGTELVDRATAAVRRTFADAPGDVGFQVFEAYEMAGPGARPTYASVARAFGLSELQVTKHLSRVRERIRAEMRRELRETVSSEGELEAEWRALFQRG